MNKASEASEYPTEEELETIKNWSHEDFNGLMEYIESIWHWGNWGFRKRGKTYWFSTGGWSGNEEIIGALQNNTMFWMCCLQSYKRGGHYKFKIPYTVHS